jgi:hypothetical protein
LLYFSDHEIGTDPEKWGQFGDFFGGTLNPIISLASLVTLGYLTYLVSTLSTQENKRLFILEMRMQAYDELVAMRLKLNLVSFDISHLFVRGLTKLPLNTLLEDSKQIAQTVRIYTELYYLLAGFEMRYGHLFNYRFRDDKFNSLKDNGKKLMNRVNATLSTKQESITIQNFPNKEESSLFFSELDQFIFALKKEL